MTSFKLFTHQENLLKLNPDKYLACWGTGTGKTLASILWAKGKARKDILVVAPKTLLVNWRRNLCEHFDVVDINANKIGNKIILTLEDGRIIYILSKEQVKKENLDKDKIDTVILDEAHYFSGIKSAMFKFMKGFLDGMPYVMLLTATPYLSTPFNIMALGQLLGRKDYDWSWINFKKLYFYEIKLDPRNKFSRRIMKVKNNIEPEMAKRVRSLGGVVSMEDCVDMPDSVFRVEYLGTTPEQDKTIKNLFEPHPISYWTKTHQIYGGGLKGDEYTETELVKNNKMDIVRSLVTENKKVIVVCRYKHEAAMYEEFLCDIKPVFSITGDTENRQDVIDKAEAMDECVIVVNAMISEGWEAKTFDTMVFHSYDFSLKNYIQMIGRIQRIDSLKKCQYVSLVVEGTIDEDIYQSVVIRKQDFHLEIYNDEQE